MKRFGLMQAVQTLTTFQTVKPLVPMAEPDRLQPGESVAAAGAAEAVRQLVADEFAAAARQNRRAFDQARPVLLAAFSGEADDAVPVWKHGAAPVPAG